MITSSVLNKYKSELVPLCQQVAGFIRAELYKVEAADIETKDMNSLVSYVDKEAEKMIVKRLSDLLPESGFITEEGTVASTLKKDMWIIDPLDGTTNFLRKLPHFSISIALRHEDDVVLGIVYDVMLEDAYTAIRGEGAWKGDKKLKVSDTATMSEAIVITGFPYERDQQIAASFEVLKHCIQHCRGIRRLGSAALDLAYLSAGIIDIYYENSLNIWDLAAGALLVEEAGGTVTDYSGGDTYLNNGSIISSNGILHASMAQVIHRFHNSDAK